MKFFIDEMRSLVIKHFDGIFELIEEFQAGFSDRLGSTENIIAKLIGIMERKSVEIDDKNLYKMNHYLN